MREGLIDRRTGIFLGVLFVVVVLVPVGNLVAGAGRRRGTCRATSWRCSAST